jgi:hypothetical protein
LLPTILLAVLFSSLPSLPLSTNLDGMLLSPLPVCHHSCSVWEGRKSGSLEWWQNITQCIETGMSDGFYWEWQLQ